MRAWYDANLGYQQVQQTRLPKTLPKVSASCALMTLINTITPVQLHSVFTGRKYSPGTLRCTW